MLWKYIEKRFVFFPTETLQCTPDDAGLAYQDVCFDTQDGFSLHGWYVPGTGDVTFLWFHGNGGNISHRVEELALLHHRLKVNVFLFDYRGYGRSEGEPSEAGTYLDARAAADFAKRIPGSNPEKLVYFGHSLGTAVAVELAAVRPPLGLVLVSPFASASDMARITMPVLPVGWLVRDHYNSLVHIGKIHRPLLVLHGQQDETVPVAQARKLFDAANEPKELRILPSAGHNDTFIAGESLYWDALERFLGGLADGRPIE